MAKVRRATAQDVNALLEMGLAMHAESPRYRHMPFDPAKLQALAGDLMQAQTGLLLVAEVDGRPIGMFAGLISERWFGPQRYATDLAVYVRPEHRGGSAFLRLVQAFESWAAAAGVVDIDIGVSTGVQVDQTVRAYQRLGYTLLPTRIVTKRTGHVHGG